MSESIQAIVRSQREADGVLLNAMHAAQNHLGYLSDEAIDALAYAFSLSRAEVLSAASFYGMLRLGPPAPVRIQVCRSAPCHVAGAREVIAAFEAELGIPMGETTADGKYTLEYVECLGQCQASPTVVLDGRLVTGVTPEQVKSLLGGGVREVRIALRNKGNIDPEKIDDYIAAGGYAALAKARATDRKQLLDTLERSGKLRGRGGAAFNTGLKWTSAFAVDSEEKYIICNADEGEPGTYKDRVIIESDPHTVIEGLLIGAHVIGAGTGFIYCRGEYPGVIALLENAIGQAEERGLCGGVKLCVAIGAGSYVCGEETALIESLEGGRGEPRLKPPFPTIAGFRGKPTVVNNVETFASVPCIVDKGAEWFSGIGAPSYPGTKVFSLSGDVVNRDCFELPTDVTLRQVIEDCGGGVTRGGKLKAVQVGGSSCAFLTPAMLDTAVDFDSMRSVDAALGSGAILVIDDSHNMADIVASTTAFFAHESCGKCAPCREGSRRAAQLARKIADDDGTVKDLDQLKSLSEYLPMTCFCPLGQSATIALASAMKLFPQDFAERLRREEKIMSMVNLVIDDKPVATSPDATILEAASGSGIRIPTLCMLKGLNPKANCRLCVVEVERMRTFAPACATRVAEGMVVRTDTARLRQSRKTTLELLLSRHAVDCHHCLRIGNSYCADLNPEFCEMCFFCDCVRDGNCELQALAREYEVDALPYDLEPQQHEADCSTGSVIRNPNKCIHCRRCVDTCAKVQTVGALGIVNRGAKTLIAPGAASLKESACVQCGRCIDACPTGAIYAREKIDEVIFHAHRYDVATAALVSADIIPRLAELGGMAQSEVDLRAVAAGLRKIGIDQVVLEDFPLASALADAQTRLANAVAGGKTVLMTASHAAEKFVRSNYPELADSLIRRDSVQQRFGKLVRDEWSRSRPADGPGILTVSVTQTHAHAGEAVDTGCVDYVIDANELHRMFMRTGVNLKKIPAAEFDTLGDAPAIATDMRALLTPEAWETTTTPHELTVTVNGKNIKALKCTNLGQARAALDAVAEGKTDAAVISLFS